MKKGSTVKHMENGDFMQVVDIDDKSVLCEVDGLRFWYPKSSVQKVYVYRPEQVTAIAAGQSFSHDSNVFLFGSKK